MKTTALVCANVVGGQEVGHWCQTFIGGNLFIAAEVESDLAVQIGKKFLDNIDRSYQLEPPNTLDSLKRFLNISGGENPNITYTVALVHDGILYVVIKGGGQAWLKRDNKKVILLKVAGSISGEIKAQDLLFLGSSTFFTQISEQDVSLCMDVDGPTGMAEALAPKLHSQDKLPAVSAVIVKVAQVSVGEAVEQQRPKALINLTKLKNLTVNIKNIFKGICVHLYHTIAQKPIILIISILVILLIISVVFGIKRQKVQRTQSQAETKLTDVIHKYDEAIALIDLNPIRARQLLEDAKQEVEEVAKVNTNKVLNKQIQDYQGKIDQGIAFALRKYTVNLTIFFELDLLKKGGIGKYLSLYEDNLAIGDVVNKSIYQLNISTKASKILASADGLANLKGIAIYDKEVFVLTDTVGKTSDGTIKTVLDKDESWGSLSAIYVYAGNIYLADSSNNKIWKYMRLDSGYGKAQNYLSQDTNVVLAGTSGLAINGSVWLSKDNQVLKFTQGVQNSWKLNGLDDGLGNQLAVFVNDDTKNIYILDKNNQRVIIATKEGEYLAQYVWKEDVEVSDMVVSEKLAKILLLSRGTIYGVDIK